MRFTLTTSQKSSILSSLDAEISTTFTDEDKLSFALTCDVEETLAKIQTSLESELKLKIFYDSRNYPIIGKFISILKTLNFAGKKRNIALNILNLSESSEGLLKIFNSSVGQTPYCNKEAEIIPEIPQKPETLRKVLRLIASEMKLAITADMLCEITSENWRKSCESALSYAMKKQAELLEEPSENEDIQEIEKAF